MSKISQLLSTLENHWKQEKISFYPGLEEAEIVAFERSHQVRLPVDLQAFYRRFDGCDDFYFRFLRLSELEHPSAIPRQGDISHYDISKKEFVIVDYMQYCWWYTIDLSDRDAVHTPVGISGTLQNQIIAPSFSAFIDLYLSDDRALYPSRTEAS